MQAIQFFCHCIVQSKHVHHLNEVNFGRFRAAQEDADRKCCHHEITMEGKVENMKRDIEQIQYHWSTNKTPTWKSNSPPPQDSSMSVSSGNRFLALQDQNNEDQMDDAEG